MNDAVDFAKIVNDSTDLQQRMIKIGQQIERDRLVPHLQAIFNAYRKALTSSKFSMPPALHQALADAQREVGEMRDLQPARDFISEADKVNAYAEAGIRKDQQARHAGRPEHDTDLVGRALKAGM